MSSVGRWTVRDSSGRGWTFVSLSIARPDERERASPANAAAWTIDSLFGRDGHQDVLVQLAGVSASDARHYTRDRLKALVKQRVGPLGPLLLLDDSGRGAGAGAASTGPTVLPERRVAEAIMARRSTITFSGQEYRVVAAFSATDLRDTSEFYVVRLAEARTVLARMSESPVLGSAAQQEAAAEAVNLLVDDRQGSGTGGIFLLRRSQQTFYVDEPVEPASTPSALRAAAKKDIKVTFIESPSGRPISGAVVRLEAPGGSESRLTTSAAGSIELTSLDPGTCFATSVIKDATAAMSFVPGAPPPPPVVPGAESGGSGGGSTASSSGSSASPGASGPGGTSGATPGTSSPTSGAGGTGSGGAGASGGGGFGLNLNLDVGSGGVKASASVSLNLSGGLSAAGSLLGGGSAAPAAAPSALPGAGAPGGGAPGAPGAAGGAAPGAGGAAAPGAAAAPAAKPPTGPIGPGFLVTVETYRVKTGDTKESIARETQVAWDDIAKFNWGTTADADLQTFFREQVGCTKMTPDEESYIFDDSDEPGIIMIPHEWTSSFAVGEEHTVYVAPMRSVYITLENEAGIPIPGAAFEAVFADGSVRNERLGRSGIARLTGVPEGPFSVAYPDPRDVFARSLAASTRKAFDDQATGPLFFLLAQEQQIIDQAIGYYEQYFDDLSGEGLLADIDQVVTDPDARPPLIFLCTLAGLTIEGGEGATVEELGPGVEDATLEYLPSEDEGLTGEELDARDEGLTGEEIDARDQGLTGEELDAEDTDNG